MNKLLILNNSMVEKSHYDKAFNEIKEYVFKNLKFVKYIIRYGNLKHPGISDLDIILIIKKEQNCNIDLSLLKFNHFLKKYYSNIVFHFPLIINEILIDNLNDLFPIFKFSCYDKYGNKVNYNLKSSDEQNKFNLLRIFQSKFPRNFYNYKYLNNENLREFLLEINSLKHTFKIFQELKSTKLEIKINLFIETINHIRNQQINKKPHEIGYLLDFLSNTEELFFEMVKELNKLYLDEKTNYKLEENIWAHNQLKIIAAQEGIMSKKIKQTFFRKENLNREFQNIGFQNILNSIDEYIKLNSKYSLFFRSSTFITLGQETNNLKRIIKSII